MISLVGVKPSEVNRTRWWRLETPLGVYTVFHVCPIIVMTICLIFVNVTNRNREWNWIIIWGGIMCLAAPWCEDGIQFFRAGIRDDDISKLGFFLISLSTFRAWVFAKSIFNASNLGGSYGIVGGLAYACWYGSFFCIALSVYRIRQVPFNL